MAFVGGTFTIDDPAVQRGKMVYERYLAMRYQARRFIVHVREYKRPPAKLARPPLGDCDRGLTSPNYVNTSGTCSVP